MPIVTVKDKYQVVIPKTVRKQLGINPGDLLEAKVERGKLTYTRKTLLDRLPTKKADRDRFFRQLRAEAPQWLREMWAASEREGLDKMTMREIDAEIAAERKARPSRTHREHRA